MSSQWARDKRRKEQEERERNPPPPTRREIEHKEAIEQYEYWLAETAHYLLSYELVCFGEITVNIEAIDENLIDIQLQEQALELAKRRAKWNANRGLLSSVVNALHKIGLEPELTGDLNVPCSGNKQRLAQIVRIFRTAGFSTTAERPKQGDSSWYAYFDHPECSIRIWFVFSSSVCRRVKTGTKMVEVDIYETVCGEATPAIEHTVDAIEHTSEEPALLSDQL